MTNNNDFATGQTFIDILGGQYDELRTELNLLHGQLQYVAAGQEGDRYHHFEDQMWYYSINQFPENEASPNRCWHKLDGPSAKNIMVERFETASDTATAVLKLTNNPHYIHSYGTLPKPSYNPLVIGICSNDENPTQAETQDLSIYPVLFKLRRMPVLSFPSEQHKTSTQPIHYSPTSADYSTLGLEQLKYFSYGFPPGMGLIPLA